MWGSLLVIGATFAAPVDAANAVSPGAHFRQSHGEPLNDPRATPGAILTSSAVTVCRLGYATRVRDVPASEKYRVYAEYAIAHHVPYEYEVDHLIPLELGGSNAMANLWPEWNDHPHGYLNSKDILENRLHRLVCAGALALRSAQTQIATDWVATYHRYLGSWPRPGSPTARSPVTSEPGASSSRPSASVSVSMVLTSVAPGGRESLTAHSSVAKDTCDLVVVLPSGRRSTAGGLGSTTTNARGEATWTWRIASTTGAGAASATVTCRAGSARTTFVIS